MKSKQHNSDATRFKEFARKIVNVPKEEIDKREAAYQWDKKQRKLKRQRITERN
jgi:hypothetical protein